ncbi:hypothetical protein GGI12_004256 [Dipsacomyces acuminosporus]|nr:hypothetical protein GGI12_004256 [Dipsacomyces acuminosporus]
MMKENGHWAGFFSRLSPQKAVLEMLRTQYEAALEKLAWAMSNVLQFTAISGANNEDALCYMLEIDDARILLDCGSFEDYSGESLVQLRRVARQVDAVLLSHPDMAHLGAYALAYSKYGLTCPAYATGPVRNMGRLCMLDVVRSLRAREEFDMFSEADVRAAFENIDPLRYSQPTSLPGKHSDIVVTAHSAGHTIGGTIWTIKKGAEQVLYAMDYNHVKESHLNKTSLLPGKQGQVSRSLIRPMLLITDSYNAGYNLQTRTKRVNCFFDTIDAVTQKGGNVLVPVDSTARVLEIAYILDQRWAEKKLHRQTHPLFLLGRCARHTMQFAQSMLEWMAESVTNQFSSSKSNPFELQHITIVQNINEFDAQMSAIYDDPKSRSRFRPRGAVVLATLEGMSLGYSQELFLRWAEDPKSAVILPQRGPPSSLARDLFTRWWSHVQAGQRPSEPIRLADPVKLPKATVDVVRRRVDEYGEIYDPKLYMREFDQHGDEIVPDVSGAGYLSDSANALGGPGILAADEDDFADDFDASQPTKLLKEERQVKLRCRLSFIDLEGRSDGRSVRNILVQIEPKRVVIVHGSSEGTQLLADYCRDPEVAVTKEIYTPGIGEIVNVSSGANAYSIKLTDALLSRVHFAKVQDGMLGFISGRIKYAEDEEVPVLDVDPAGLENAWQPPVMIGDSKLSVLKRVLKSHGIQAEFSQDGTLVCNGSLAIRRTETDRIRIQGNISPDYYKIRSLVYEHLTVV